MLASAPLRIALDTIVAAPAERVFDLYVNPDRVPEWRPSVKDISNRSGPMDAPGSTFTTRYRNATPDSHGVVVQSKRPRNHVLAGRGIVRYEARIDLEPVGSGTRLRFHLCVVTPGGHLGCLIERVVLRRKLEEETCREFARFRQLAERDR